MYEDLSRIDIRLGSQHYCYTITKLPPKWSFGITTKLPIKIY